MKRSFVVNLFGGFVGFILALLVLSFANNAKALSLNRPAVSQAPASIVSAPSATSISSNFTYQGQLKNGGSPVSGVCNMAFRLYDDPGVGNLIGSPITLTTVSVVNGYFTVGLNFGSSAFTGEARWLDIRVRCPAGSGSYTLLTPRQALTPAPVALTLGSPGSLYGYLVDAASPGPYPTLGFNTYGTAYLAGVEGYGGILQFQDRNGKLVYYTGSYVVSGSPHANTARVAITNNGNVGIGTTDPLTLLHLKGNTATSGNNTAVFENTAIGPNASAIHYGTSGDWYIRSAAASGKVVIQDTGGNVGIGTSSPNATLDVNGDIQGNSLTAPTDLFLNATGRIALRTTPGGLYAERMTILNNGNIGIGTTAPGAKVHVHSTGTTGATDSLYVDNGNGDYTLAVSDDGRVFIGHLGLQSGVHVCIAGSIGGSLDECASAAEYVPTIDTGLGFPETADLVSIVPVVKNPYGDSHSPFTVQKSANACDPNLLGFITDPEKGADGEKKNDHYLPLAIYGYFPAKVTLENGAIHRGDPLTSSSKPGYAMKATQACKIIGYALEDADHEGTIQVFAHLSENAAPEVASLRDQVKQLKEQNAAFEARLAALERTTSGQAPTQSAAPRDVVLFGAMFAIVGIVAGWRMNKRGSQ